MTTQHPLTHAAQGRTPIVVIHAPQLHNGLYTVALEINLPEGQIRAMATAPQPLVAKALAYIQGYVSYQTSSRLMGRGAVAGEVGSIWGDIWGGIKSVVNTPVVRNLIKSGASMIPAVGPVLAATGATDMLLDAGMNAVDKVTNKKPGADKAQQALAALPKQAKKAPSKKQRQKARTVNRAALAAARMVRDRGKKGLADMKGLVASHRLIRDANAGDSAAINRLGGIAKQAVKGNPQALRAAGYLALAEKARHYSYDELEPDDDERLLDELEAEEDEAAEFWEVGADGRAFRVMSDGELVRMLRGIRQKYEARRRAVPRKNPKKSSRRAA